MQLPGFMLAMLEHLAGWQQAPDQPASGISFTRRIGLNMNVIGSDDRNQEQSADMDRETPQMSDLRKDLEKQLLALPKITIATWKDTDLVCVFFDGREFAHFHGENILDLRLSPKIIREEKLSRAVSKQIHPTRSPNSRWIGIAFTNSDEVDRLVHLVQRACHET